MLKRYDYEDPRAAGHEADDGIRVIDRFRGSDKAIAVCESADDARWIVQALNAEYERQVNSVTPAVPAWADMDDGW